MFFSEENGVLTARSQYETLRIEAWGKDALRVRATQYSGFSGRDWALSESPDGGPGKAKVEILEGQKIEMGDVSFVIRQAVVTNGRISVRINPGGVLFFYRDGELILQEYSRNYMGNETGQSACLKVDAREFKPIIGGDYSLTVRFDGRDGEKIFGMGQYQQSQMDLKGCTLELAQRNSQISIPFALSAWVTVSCGTRRRSGGPPLGTITLSGTLRRSKRWTTGSLSEIRRRRLRRSTPLSPAARRLCRNIFWGSGSASCATEPRKKFSLWRESIMSWGFPWM